MTVTEPETVETVGERFPELDEAARRRAIERVKKGSDTHEAFATESVQTQITKAYN